MGLASPGGVHAHQDHLVFLANLVAGQGVPVWIHAFLDGRDMPPRSALECLDRYPGGPQARPADRFRDRRRPLLRRWTATSAGSA
jgi:2,3-bisphosphoglycerate-independent phosphoglycerate mutase